MADEATLSNTLLGEAMRVMIDEILRYMQTHGTCDRAELAVFLDASERRVTLAFCFLEKYGLVNRDFLGVRVAPATLRFLRDLDSEATAPDN